MRLKFILDDKKLMRGFSDFPKANVRSTRDTLNTVAAISRRNAIDHVQRDFILRNTFTTRNIQFDKAEGDIISKMVSRTGATERADYMETQETGGKRKLSSKSSGGTAIPQKTTRLGRSARKEVSKSFYLRSIRGKLVRGRMKKNFTSHKARFVARAAVAHKTGKFIKRKSGAIVVVNQFSKSGRNRVTASTDLLYTLSKGRIYIKPDPWLRPSIAKPVRDFFNIYKSNLRKLWKNGEFH